VRQARDGQRKNRQGCGLCRGGQFISVQL
jgi:hypothetical protein